MVAGAQRLNFAGNVIAMRHHDDECIVPREKGSERAEEST